MADTEEKEITLEKIIRILGDVEIIVDDKTASQNFKDSLAIGNTVEDQVCAKIRKKYPKAYVKQGYCKGYDIYVPETNKKIEVKQDKKASNADKTPEKLKNRWRERILEAERKSKDESTKDSSSD